MSALCPEWLQHLLIINNEVHRVPVDTEDMTHEEYMYHQEQLKEEKAHRGRDTLTNSTSAKKRPRSTASKVLPTVLFLLRISIICNCYFLIYTEQEAGNDGGVYLRHNEEDEDATGEDTTEMEESGADTAGKGKKKKAAKVRSGSNDIAMNHGAVKIATKTPLQTLQEQAALLMTQAGASGGVVNTSSFTATSSSSAAAALSSVGQLTYEQELLLLEKKERLILLELELARVKQNK